MKKFNTKHAIKNNFVSTEEREGVLINRVKLSKQRHKKLDKGKGKKVGFIESIVLKITGYCDGRKGLPRLNHKDMNRRLIAKRVSDYADFVRIREERQKELEQLEKEYEDVCNKIAAIEER